MTRKYQNKGDFYKIMCQNHRKQMPPRQQFPGWQVVKALCSRPDPTRALCRPICQSHRRTHRPCQCSAPAHFLPHSAAGWC